MSWLGISSSSTKSITKNAQNIIKNLHQQLTKQQEHIIELEKIIHLLQRNYKEPIVHEIHRLENLKKNYQEKINEIDLEILQQQKLLTEIDEKLSQLSLNVRETSSNDDNYNERGVEELNDKIRNGHGHHVSHDDRHGHSYGSENDTFPSTTLSTSETNNNYNEREDEHELLEAIRLIESNVLFILYRNNIDDVIVYFPSTTNSTNEIISLYRIRDPSDRQSIEEISTLERMMVYGPKLISNSQRNEPNVIEIPYPGLSTHTGELVGCIQLPIASNILIDIWKCSLMTSQSTELSSSSSSSSSGSSPPSKPSLFSSSTAKYWATVTINQINYAILECLYVKSELRWGFTTVTSVEITARHPVDGRVIVEEIAVN